VWNNIILCYERENITVQYFCGHQHSIVSENGGLIMFKWLKKIFHRKPSPCDNCDTCKNGCNKHVATEKELQDFMKYRGSLMDNEQ
jgi:hypothetical protein